jgi:hypothetical protein
MTLILEPKFSKRILITSHLIWISIATSYLNQLYFCTFLTTLVYVTSLAYWSHPVKGFRRSVDMVCAATGFLYHFLLSTSSQRQLLYFAIVAIGLAFYLMARSSKNQNHSSFYHCCMVPFSNQALLWSCIKRNSLYLG